MFLEYIFPVRTLRYFPMGHSHFLSNILEKSQYFMPHGHCYLWIPSLLWLHVISDFLIGIAYLGISLILYALVRKIRLPFSPVFIAFGLFIGLCGLTHFMEIWTVWNPDYWIDGWIKAATAAASVATAIGLLYVRPQIEEVTHAARLSEERRIKLESTHAVLESLYERVTELNEVKSQFFANVSHELRTPLSLILGPAEKMLQDSNLTQEQRRQLESIGRNGRLLLKQVNDLLDASKLEAARMEIRYARLDVAAWLRRIASQFEGVAQQRNIRFELSTPDSLLAEADPDMLERVFINLLSNAFKFTPDNGKISVALSSDPHRFNFLVADTGPGIAPDQRQVIFERFRQADGGSTRKHGGTGLGLSIAKDFVELHGGGIAVGDSPDGGAQFTVAMPLKAPEGTSVSQTRDYMDASTQLALDASVQELSASLGTGAADSGARHLPERPTVLVVEDNAEMRSFIAGILRDSYNIATASDGVEGLERATALRPDLVITDIMMPRMSGDQLVKALRDQPVFNALPVLLLSAKADDELRIALLREGAQDYVNKPFIPHELQARVANLIAMKRAGDALRESLSSASEDLEGLATELGVKHRQLQIALEATEVAREQAEKANRVKAEFLALVSHELRTPLSTIDMNIQLLAATKDGGSAPAATSIAMDRLTRATRQMSTLVEGLLQYTRIESGTLQIHPEKIDITELLTELIALHAPTVPPDVKLILNPPREAQRPLRTDPRLLRVMLTNLVSNAIKFTQAGTITLNSGSDEGGHFFSVHDTGIGIPEADLERIFLPFEQLEPVRRKSIPGIGLGLSIVKQLAEALGGSIEVKSEVGTGSSFTVYLPEQYNKQDVVANKL